VFTVGDYAGCWRSTLQPVIAHLLLRLNTWLLLKHVKSLFG
jgi:hypothetical protein